MSMFDPNAFLDAQTTEANEKRPPLPAENPEDPNGTYVALIGEIGTDSGTIGKGERQGQPWVSMLVPLQITVPASLQASGFPKTLTITDRVFLDLTANGGMDNGPGKNNRQRLYREATGLNKKGEPFAWRMLQGKPIRVKISHELYNENIQERIAQVLPL